MNGQVGLHAARAVERAHIPELGLLYGMLHMVVMYVLTWRSNAVAMSTTVLWTAPLASGRAGAVARCRVVAVSKEGSDDSSLPPSMVVLAWRLSNTRVAMCTCALSTVW